MLEVTKARVAKLIDGFAADDPVKVSAEDLRQLLRAATLFQQTYYLREGPDNADWSRDAGVLATGGDFNRPTIPTVVVIKDGVTKSVEIYADGEAAELAFAREVSCYGVEAGEQDYDDGYIELEDATICICWATNNSKQSINK